MTKREKNLLGIFLFLAVLIGGVYFFLWPQAQAALNNNQQKTVLAQDAENLQVKQQRLEADVAYYKEKIAETEDLKVVYFEPSKQAKGIKYLIDKLTAKAVSVGNSFVSLKPYETTQPSLPEKTPSQRMTEGADEATNPDGATSDGFDTQPSNGTTSSNGSSIDPNIEAAQPLPLQAAGYELEVRGTYSSITRFLASLKTNEETIEIEGYTLTNEAGPQREDDTLLANSGAHVDPSKPIRLKTKLRLFMMQERLQG